MYKYKKYVFNYFLFLIFSFFFISLINIIVDPGNIYFRKLINDYNVNKYVKKLKSQKIGLVQDMWNERSVKTTLAKISSDMNCIILGSSHVLQISSVRNTGNIQNQCKELINLGVSGGSLEDIFVFSNIILNKKILPEQVFIGIDPWTLKFNMDSRYLANKDLYKSMLKLLNIKDNYNKSYESKIIKNLINYEYFLSSLTLLIKDYKQIFDLKKILEVKEIFDFSKGYDYAVTLIDGSHIYKKSWIAQKEKIVNDIPYGGGLYKISGKPYDELAIDNLIALIKFYRKKGIKINFILTPYHPNVFKKGKTKAVDYMNIVEEKVIELSLKYNINIFGSFFPSKFNCKENEFFDFMHPKIDCLNKIDLSGN